MFDNADTMFCNPLPSVPYLSVPRRSFVPIWQPGDDGVRTIRLRNSVLDPYVSGEFSLSPSGLGELQPVDLVVTRHHVVATMSGGVAGRTYTALFTLMHQSGEETVLPVSVYVSPVLGSWPPTMPPSYAFGPSVSWIALPGLVANGAALMLVSTFGWPPSSACVPPGGVYANGNFVGVVTGYTFNPYAKKLFFGTALSWQLLDLGARGMQFVDPLVLDELWVNSSIVNISAGPPGMLQLSGQMLTLSNTLGWAPSTVGLLPGALWASGTSVAVVPGAVPDPAAPAVFFGSITGPQLAVLGGGNFPLVDPLVLNQIWNNGDILYASAG